MVKRWQLWVLLLVGVVGHRTLSPTRPALASPLMTDSMLTTLTMLEETGRVFEAVGARVSPSVVHVESRVYDSKGAVRAEESGSGIVVLPKGASYPVIVTNLHVIGEAKPANIDVALADGRLFHPTRVIPDPDTDLAVLELDARDLPPAPLADSDQVRVGQWVLVIGSPFGLAQSVTHGIISAKHRRQLGLPGTVRIKEFLQTDAPINPGNSGGPLVNLRGEVIGVNTAIASRTGVNSGVGFAIPVNLVRWVTDEIANHGEVRRGFLGVQFPSRFTYEKAQSLGLEVLRGALVLAVHADTPAAAAGLRVDDVILEFDQLRVDDENHLINVVSQTPIGREVEMLVWRQRHNVKLSVRLGSWQSYRQTSK